MMILTVLYLALSPVFIDTEYALSERVKKDQSYIYFDVWVWPWDDFKYYMLFSKFKYTIHEDSFRFVIQDYGKNVRSFKILNMSSSIDSHTYAIKNFSNDNVVLDKSNGNGNGGDAGVAAYDFIMPEIPKNKFDVRVNGIITYDNGEQEKVSVIVPNTIHRKKDTKLFFKYQIEKLSF